MINRVVIDASSAASGGGLRFLSSMCHSLAEISPETTFYLLQRESQRSQIPPMPSGFHWIEIPQVTKNRLFRLIWLQLTMPRIVKRLEPDVLLAATEITTLRPPCPMVLVVHNFAPFSHLRNQIWNRRGLVLQAVMRQLTRRCAQRADKVVFVSESSRQNMSPDLGISLQKSTVVYHGVEDLFRPARSNDRTNGDKNRFLLVVSAVREHKNLQRLLVAYHGLTRRLGKDIDLVIAGPIDSLKVKKSLEFFLEEKGLLPNVRFLGSVSTEELASLYQQAELLAFPSLTETFGIPLIEAMASGLPIVVSNYSAMPEIAGDAALYFNPLDVTDMTDAMGKVLTDSSLRSQMVRKGLERASTFSWQKAAQQLLATLDSVSRDSPMKQPVR